MTSTSVASLQSLRLSRRQFIAQSTCAALAGVVASSTGCRENAGPAVKPVVGSNVYGWTQYAKCDKKPFDAGEVMSALHDLGYDYLETNMDFEHPAAIAKLADDMRAKGLTPVSLYVGPRLHEADKAKGVVQQLLAAAKVCKESGFQVISCNAAPIGRAKTDEELKTQVAALTEFGQGLNELGMKLGVHHHMPEMANGAREFHYDFRNSDPKIVGFCYDVNWVWKGGVQPLDALRQYGNRVVTWHLRQSRNGVWWEDLDNGDIDYAAIAQYAKEHRLPPRYTVELALEPKTVITRSAIENHKRSREYVRKVFGV